MDWGSFLNLFLKAFVFLDVIIIVAGCVGIWYIKPRWPGWWERWVVAPYPNDFEPEDNLFC